MTSLESQSKRDIFAELQKVRVRLAELEETTHAIRSGAVDAIVVEGPKGSQIFTLQSPEDPYRIFVERMKEGAATVTAEGTILFCNHRLAEMAGLPPERVLGSSLCLMLPENRRMELLKLLEMALSSDVRAELELLRFDGSLMQVLLSISLIALDKSGNSLCVVMTDVSELNRIKNGLKAQAEIFELAHDAILIQAMDGRIQTWNHGAQDLYGWSSAEAVGKIGFDLMQAEFPVPMQTIIDALHENKLWEGELIHVARSGAKIIVDSRWSLLRDEYGKPVSILVINRDVTERSMAEQARAQAELAIHELNRQLEDRIQARTSELIAINEELEAFSYSVSHDLRAPLRHLDGFLTLLSKKIYNTIDERAAHYLDCALGSSQRMGRLIDELLQFARLSRDEMHKVPVDLNEVIGDIKQELGCESSDRNMLWHVERLPTVVVDPGMIRQVISNLLENSLKFTRHRSLPAITIGSRQDSNGEVIIFVRDNGEGFDMKYYSKLFQVFQRLHGEQEFEGTGIGLAIVRRIVERQGGKVWAEGEVGVGATFYFSMPQKVVAK